MLLISICVVAVVHVLLFGFVIVIRTYIWKYIYIGLSSKYRSDDDDDFADRGTVRASGAADHLYRKQVSRFALQKRHTVHLAVHLAHQCSRSRRAHAA